MAGDAGAWVVTRIVPEVDPYALPRSATLPVRVIYQGRPLAKLTDLKNDAQPVEMHVTDRAGRARFVMPPPAVGS